MPTFNELVEAVEAIDPAAAEHLKGLECANSSDVLPHFMAWAREADQEAKEWLSTRRLDRGEIDEIILWDTTPQGQDYWLGIAKQLSLEFLGGMPI